MWNLCLTAKTKRAGDEPPLINNRKRGCLCISKFARLTRIHIFYLLSIIFYFESGASALDSLYASGGKV